MLNINKLSFFILILVSSSFYLCHSGTLPASQVAEQTLITSLLNGYNRNIRPDDEVSVDITATLQQIVNIDEKQQIMTSSSFISQTWFDDRLSWTPNASNNNIEVVMLPVRSLWIPDTMILNSADASGYLSVNDYSLASVSSRGQVYMILPTLTIRTRCGSYVRDFPFDTQMCAINITSWSQGANRIAYTRNASTVIDISQYIEHPLWALVKTDIVVIESGDRAPFEETYNDIISIRMYFKRKPLFFMFNGIFACLVLNFVTLLSFSLPFAPQIGLCMTSFMTYSVYSLNFSNLFPQQSEYLMTITLYFLLSITWTLIAMTWFIICERMNSQGEMPKLLFMFAGFLKRLLSYCFLFPKAANAVKAEHEPATNLSTVTPKDETRLESIPSTPVKPVEASTAKPKCGFCNRCPSCQNEADKEKVKASKKKEIQSRCSALNYFAFFCVLLLMFVSNLVIWISMSI